MEKLELILLCLLLTIWKMYDDKVENGDVKA